MKDFADLANSSGAFPDVVGVDCSGPGETDGTELTNDFFNDLMGAFQALLNAANITPSGSAESGSGTSQILQAIQFAMASTYTLPLSLAASSLTGGALDWEHWGTGRLKSLVNSGLIHLGINLPRGISQDITITAHIKPGAVRAGGNRVNIGLYKKDHDGLGANLIGSLVYDDGSTSGQDLVLTNTSVTPAVDSTYYLVIQAGNTGAAAPDYVFSAKIDIAAA